MFCYLNFSFTVNISTKIMYVWQEAIDTDTHMHTAAYACVLEGDGSRGVFSHTQVKNHDAIF